MPSGARRVRIKGSGESVFPSGSVADLYDCFYFESYWSYRYASFQDCYGYDTDSYG